MHKVQMNSSSFDPESVKKRISHFKEFDNGHVLFDYQKMSVADSEEKAKQASIKHPDDVYYVSYDNLMNSCSDTYWFQGVAYDNAGAWEALRNYRKSKAGLNSGRRPLNSSEEQTKVSGIVTIYSDFVDFKRSVSEHLLQTAVGDRAKLKFKWVGDNKVEVKAICSVADERKVKILLENSDVTKTITWNTSANSSRLNSSVGPCFATLWPAYIDDEYKCACCGKPFPAGHNSVHLNGHKPDGMHFIFEYTKENREGNSVNYDPYNLPKEDPEGGIFKVVVGEDADDEGYHWLNFCRNCWPKLTSMSPEEIYAKYSPDAKAGGLNSSKGGKSMRKVNSGKTSRKKLNSSYRDSYVDVDGIMGSRGDVWTIAELADYWNREQHSDPCLDEYASYEDWLEDTLAAMRPVNSSRKHINSNRKVGNNSMRKVIFRGKLNSSRKSAQKMQAGKRKLNSSLVDTFLKYHDDAENYQHQEEHFDELYEKLSTYAKPGENPEDMYVDELFVRATPVEQQAMVALIDPKNWNEDLDSSRKPAQRTARKKLNSSRDDIITELEEYYTHDEAVEYIDSFEEQTGAKAIRLATPDEAEMYDGAFWAVKDGVEKLWCRGNGYWYECKEDFDSSRKLNSSEGESDDDADAGESVGEGGAAPASEGETEVQDTGVDGGEDAAETAEILEDALIVQNPETKEVALFIADAEDETVPEDVDVIAEVDVVADETEVLDSSRRLKKFATAKLNSSKSCLNSDEEDEDVCPGCGKPMGECECEPGTVAYDEIQLPDDTVVEVENILVVQDGEGELGLFMPEDAEESVPEGYEVVATATPAAEADVLDSSRRMKKSNAKKLNSSAKRKNH